MGIRMALGAQRRDVLGMVLRQGMMPVLTGMAAGALSAVAIGRYLESLLFHVSPRDPLAFAVSGASFYWSPWRPAWSPRAAPRVSAPSRPCASIENVRKD